MREHLRAVRIVETEDRCLRKDVRGTQAGWVVGVSFDLGRTAFVAFNQKSYPRAGERHGRREEQGLARDELFRLPDVGNDVFRGLTGAGADPGEGHGRAHQLQEPAATHRIEPFRRVLRKLAVQKLLEFRGSGDVFETAPIGAASRAVELRAKSLDVVRIVHERVTGGTWNSWCCP